ncbi:hypothetical protein BN946_scf184851.g67 [Trametes cinnabarina]|uniref:Uncharacterized protein n=1 Tax=Pycnoporus cinnabarinus TaxID=5643 RepID=A0A060SBL4_PYCCI|nr:hypothetical protein BN946_scf184851.g67 [Trametes cinnabarina]
MNVAALLSHDDDPIDDPRRRPQRHEQEPAPPQLSQQPHHPHRTPHHSPPLERPRDRDRERERPPHSIVHHAQQPPSPAYRRSPPPQYGGRPPSPSRHQPYPPSSDYPGQPQRMHQLPPPSSLYPSEPYDLSHQQRRSNSEVHPHPSDRMGPPGEHHSLLVSLWILLYSRSPFHTSPRQSLKRSVSTSGHASTASVGPQASLLDAATPVASAHKGIRILVVDFVVEALVMFLEFPITTRSSVAYAGVSRAVQLSYPGYTTHLLVCMLRWALIVICKVVPNQNAQASRCF